MNQNNSKDDAPLNGRKISDVLKTLPDNFSAPTITIGELKTALSGRAYGLLLLVLALPNLIPLPAPGLSAVLGAPLILFTFQLMLGFQTPWFPRFIARRSIKRDDVKRVCNRIVPYVKKLELIFTPRLKFLVHPPADRVIALICVVLSLMIMMPIPFGNALPALAICFFALAILQNDGLFVIFGVITTLAGATAILIFLSALFLSLSNFFAVS